MKENRQQPQKRTDLCPVNKLGSLQQKEEEWYVFVTCSSGSDGNFSINMSSYGDPQVLAFMLEGAQERLWETEEDNQE